MYAVAAQLTPDGYHALARAVYGEMALAGITCVGEFHYLHDGANAFGEALIAAAGEAGIRITLLDACYVAGGFGEPPTGAQRRFSDGDAARWAERVDGLADAPHARIGAAIHSVRAVPPTRSRRSWSGREASRCTSTSPSSAPRTRPASPPTAARRPSC